MRLLLATLCIISWQSIQAVDLSDVSDDEALAVYIHNGKSGEDHYCNRDRVLRRFTACSTFKIPNSLIALESGVVTGHNQVFKYDPEKHAHPHRKSAEYNRDQTLKSAFEISALWTYQEIARLVGEEKYNMYLDLFRYGNKDISGGLDCFWLDSLAVSAQEQVDFLRRFYHNGFNFKKNTIRTVKEMMFIEAGDSYRLYGKTGTRLPEENQWLGWIVGFVESGDTVFYFAINLECDTYKELGSKRMQVLKDCFNRLGVPIDQNNH